MATLVFTAIGTVLGGPIGGAIGALVGQTADALIFKPGPRTGPRLTDLSVQTSRYGAQIPRLYGRMRVAGTVIWATDLKEASATSGGGKGRPSVTSYSYSASLAVALSSRPIRGIGRIWADGNLLRGTAGDFKAPVAACRIHDGAAGQAVDPLIAAAVGVTQAPAFRGLAYMVLEELQLADFGNRIPSLTVEVIADEGSVMVSAIAGDLMRQDVAFLGETEPAVQGYAADGSDLGEAIGPLVDVHGLHWRGAGDEIQLVARVETGRTLAADGAVHAIDGEMERPGEKRCLPLDEVPARLSVRHFDPARDYQIGAQSAERPGPGQRSEELGLPAALAADPARALADRVLRARLAGRRSLTRACDWTALDLAPGDVVTVEGEPGRWIVEQVEWQDLAPRLALRTVAGGTASLPGAGDSGQALLPPDLVQGPTHLALVELAAPDNRLAETPLVFAAATGDTAGWRRAALLRYHAETETAEPMGATAPRAVLGTALDALADGRPWRIDGRTTVEIQLDNAADSLIDADDGELASGANLCALGAELLQYGKASLLAPGRYRLSRLVRGWRGTEWAMTGHRTGERFVLLDAARLATIPTTAGDIGRLLMMRASGAGDLVPAEAEWPVDGRAVLPPAPVHGRIWAEGGDLGACWIRRSRLGWAWRDLVDAPLGEERERYRLTLMAGETALRAIETDEPRWLYPAAERAADLIAAGGVPLSIAIRQIGTFGPSRPLFLPLS